jgi:hypothetical protein
MVRLLCRIEGAFVIKDQPPTPALPYGNLELLYLLLAEEDEDALEVPQLHASLPFPCAL